MISTTIRVAAFIIAAIVILAGMAWIAITHPVAAALLACLAIVLALAEIRRTKLPNPFGGAAQRPGAVGYDDHLCWGPTQREIGDTWKCPDCRKLWHCVPHHQGGTIWSLINGDNRCPNCIAPIEDTDAVRARSGIVWHERCARQLEAVGIWPKQNGGDL